jgi:uncharacterized tellurite resistance protein B-like protein
MLKQVITQAKLDEGAVSPADARAALEIACLAVAADGKLADEELAALRVLSAELRALAASELDALVLASLTLRTREERLDRLRAAADSLSSEQARHLAYRLSVVTALADLAAADEEFEFDLDVQDALHLSSEEADRLTAEVNEALLDQE